jgi:hypothetical protein
MYLGRNSIARFFLARAALKIDTNHFKKDSAMKFSTKILMGVLSALILYSLFGFFVAPYLIRHQIEKLTEEKLGTKAHVEKVSVNPFTFFLSVEGFDLPSMNDSESKSRLSFQKFAVNFSVLPLFTKNIRFTTVELESAHAVFKILTDGSTNWKISSAPTEQPQETKKESERWYLTLDLVKIQNSRLDFFDFTHAVPLKLPMGPISLSATHISTSLNSTSSLKNLTLSVGDKGLLTLHGDIQLKPAGAKFLVDAQEMPMNFLTAYLSDHTYLAMEDGGLYFKGELTYKNGTFNLRGNSEVLNLNIVQEGEEGSVLAWRKMGLSDINLSTRPLNIQVSELELVEPKTSIILRSDGTLNIKNFLKPKPDTEEVAATEAPGTVDAKGAEVESKVKYLVNKITIKNGKMDYSDLQIRPHFIAHIHNLEGVIGPVSSNQAEKINISLTGKVEEFGKFSGLGYFIQGEKHPSLDLGMNFHNIELTTFTPYAGRFAGYEIKKGKMFLDFRYKLINNRIKGTNKVLLDQFYLGNKVQSEKAKNVPVKLALALLRDRHGRIDFKLPVEGSLDDPSFSFGGIVWEAVKNLMVKIVTFPFDFIAGMVGGQELQEIKFVPGKIDLAEGQAEKIEKLSEAMEQRPNFALEIQPTYSPEDVEAMKQAQVKNKKEFSVSPEELKALGMARGKHVLSLFAEKKVEPGRLFLLAAKADEARPPQAILQAKEKH